MFSIQKQGNYFSRQNIEMKHLYLWMFLILLLIFCSTIHTQRSIGMELFSDSKPPTFLTADEASAFLLKDDDKYVQSMSTYDLYARKAKSQDEYLQRISQATADFDPKERGLLLRLTAEIDDKYPHLRSTPWAFLKTKGNVYEDGLPHTRGMFILISDHVLNHDDLTETLLHEKIHVYQRLNPDAIQKILKEKGYIRWKLRKDVPLARANPDLDDWIYLDPVTQKPMMAVYSNTNPSSISDVSLSNIAFEHPLEAMAYQIAQSYSSMSKAE